MTLPRSLRAAIARRAPALAVGLLAGLALAQDPQSAGPEPRAPGSTLHEPAAGFALELTVEPVAGQTLQAGSFQLELLGAEPTLVPTPIAVFSDGFEPAPGVAP